MAVCSGGIGGPGAREIFRGSPPHRKARGMVGEGRFVGGGGYRRGRTCRTGAGTAAASASDGGPSFAWFFAAQCFVSGDWLAVGSGCGVSRDPADATHAAASRRRRVDGAGGRFWRGRWERRFLQLLLRPRVGALTGPGEATGFSKGGNQLRSGWRCLEHTDDTERVRGMRRVGGWFVVRVFSALRGPLRITVRGQGAVACAHGSRATDLVYSLSSCICLDISYLKLK